MSELDHQPDSRATAAPPTMHAIVQRSYGSAPEDLLDLAEVPTPTIGAGEVLVKIAAASVDQGTCHLMAGRPELMRLMGFGLRRPKALNPGRSFAGTIVSAGGGVERFRAGNLVYGTSTGTFAEYVAAKEDKVAPMPANLTFEQAATFPVSAVAALQAARDRAQIQPGQHVLVTGASGGVGRFLVQIVKNLGGRVTGTASTAKLDLVRGLGVDEVIDHSHEDFANGDHTFDVILDTGGNRPLPQVRRVLAEGGTLVIVGGENTGRWLGGFARSLRAMLLAPFVRGQRLRTLTSRENARDLDVLRGLIEDGQLHPIIDRSYPLSETPAAIRRLMDGRARGTLVIQM